MSGSTCYLQTSPPRSSWQPEPFMKNSVRSVPTVVKNLCGPFSATLNSQFTIRNPKSDLFLFDFSRNNSIRSCLLGNEVLMPNHIHGIVIINRRREASAKRAEGEVRSLPVDALPLHGLYQS
jgi:hypothetical protein